MISMLHGKNSSSHKRKVEERRKETREKGKEERKGHSFKVPQPP